MSRRTFVIFSLYWFACHGWPPKGFFFILDDKEANNQGLDLLWDKFVKALIAATQVPD